MHHFGSELQWLVAKDKEGCAFSLDVILALLRSEWERERERKREIIACMQRRTLIMKHLFKCREHLLNVERAFIKCRESIYRFCRCRKHS